MQVILVLFDRVVVQIAQEKYLPWENKTDPSTVH